MILIGPSGTDYVIVERECRETLLYISPEKGVTIAVYAAYQFNDILVDQFINHI